MEIANKQKIGQITDRIVYQIAEQQFDSKKIVLVGLHESGFHFASEIRKKMQKVISSEIDLLSLTIDKTKPEKSAITLSQPIPKDADAIILVDDVINSGRTLFYALKPFMDLSFKSLQTLVLVERKYKRYPISADYVGMSLNTTMKEHIQVKIEDKKLIAIELI